MHMHHHHSIPPHPHPDPPCCSSLERAQLLQYAAQRPHIGWVGVWLAQPHLRGHIFWRARLQAAAPGGAEALCKSGAREEGTKAAGLGCKGATVSLQRASLHCIMCAPTHTHPPPTYACSSVASQPYSSALFTQLLQPPLPRATRLPSPTNQLVRQRLVLLQHHADSQVCQLEDAASTDEHVLRGAACPAYGHSLAGCWAGQAWCCLGPLTCTRCPSQAPLTPPSPALPDLRHFFVTQRMNQSVPPKHGAAQGADLWLDVAVEHAAAVQGRQRQRQLQKVGPHLPLRQQLPRLFPAPAKGGSGGRDSHLGRGAAWWNGPQQDPLGYLLQLAGIACLLMKSHAGLQSGSAPALHVVHVRAGSSCSRHCSYPNSAARSPPAASSVTRNRWWLSTKAS